MTIQSFLFAIDRISTTVGKAAAWLLIALTALVCIEVFRRYALMQARFCGLGSAGIGGGE